MIEPVLPLDSLDDTRRVLIVDDDVDFAESLGENLEDLGYTARHANSAQSAVDAMKDFRADAALLDVRLGSANGIELLAELVEVHPPVQCVMMTAYASVPSAIEALRAGAYDFLTKPVHPDELSITLERTFRHIDVMRARARAERALRRYRHILTATADLMGFVDREYVFQAVNDAYLEAYQRSREDTIGRTVQEIHGDWWFDHFFKPGVDRCLRGEKFHFQSWIELPSEGRRYMDLAFYPYTADEREESGVVFGLRDLTEMQQLSEKLAYEASHDALTGLINRREFEDRLSLLIANARDEDTEHALCYLDLDDFVVVNDTLGHKAGDALLRALGIALKRAARRGDTFARLGGDEFGVLMAGCSVPQATRVAHELLSLIESLGFEWNGENVTVRGSIGLVPITATSSGVDEIMIHADAACYVAKEQGRNRIHVYDASDMGFAERTGEMHWARRVHRALEDERLRLFWQPIQPIGETDATSQSHRELLIRMVEPGGAIVPAGVFLPAVERYSLASSIDQWVCTRALRWIRQNPHQLDQVSMVTINLSGRTLGDEQLLATLTAELEHADLDATPICFEVTETAAIINMVRATRFMNALRDLGCRFALDDFGSGLSSYAYLRDLPVDYLKIDGRFVRDIVNSPVDYALVKSMNEIGHVMGKVTIAEFVESQEILDALADIGVDYAQGLFVGRPKPIGES